MPPKDSWATAPARVIGGPRVPPPPRRRAASEDGATWYEATGIGQPPGTPLPVGRNGRPRNPVTMPGHGRGCKPANAGKRYPADPLTEAEVLRLLAAIPTTTKCGVRNRALVTTLWRTGLRVSEALDLQAHHVDPGSKRVTVLCGKGGKRRTVGIDDGALREIVPWLRVRGDLCVPPTAPLFCTIQLPGRGGRVNSAYVREVLHQYGRAAGITKRVHPHGFRHTIACELIRERFGLTDVQAQLGHTSPATTAIYLRGLGADEAFEKVAGREWPAGTA